MKKKWAVMMLGFLGGLSFLAIPAVVAQKAADEEPEFYFTRLMYTQGPLGRGATMRNPGPYKCPEFGGGNFFPPQGHGWLTDSPGADCKLMGAIHRMTGQSVFSNPNYIEIMSPDLFKYPYAYIVEPGQMEFSKEEAERLREYLLRGGFLHLDDFWGLRQKANLVNELHKVFPDRDIQPIPLSHPIFHAFFDIPEIIQTPNVNRGCNPNAATWEQADDKDPVVYGIPDDKGRMMVVITYNTDLGDAWEYMDRACYPQKYTGYALRMGLNFMTYAVTH